MASEIKPYRKHATLLEEIMDNLKHGLIRKRAKGHRAKSANVIILLLLVFFIMLLFIAFST